MSVLINFLLIIEPLLVLRRYFRSQKNGCITGFILNPVLYFLLLSYFYFLIPGAFLDSYPEFLGYNFDETNIVKIRMLYCYYNILFLLTYSFSVDKLIEIRHGFLSKNFPLFLKIWLTFLTMILVLVLLKEFWNIMSLRQDRIAAYSYYVNNVYYSYKIAFININIVIVSLLLALNSKKKNWFLYLLPYIFIFLLDYSHGGRAETFKAGVVIIILTAIKINRIPTKGILVLLSFMIIPSYLQRTGGAEGSIFIALGEFLITGMTPLVVLQNNLDLHFNEFVLRTLLSPFPGFIRSAFYDTNFSYINLIAETVGLGFGLAGNFVSEALIYGGSIFALISPLIISLALYFINKKILGKKMICLLFVILLIMGSQNIIRTSFYENILPIFYLIVVWLLYLFSQLNKVVFKPSLLRTSFRRKHKNKWIAMLIPKTTSSLVISEK